MLKLQVSDMFSEKHGAKFCDTDNSLKTFLKEEKMRQM